MVILQTALLLSDTTTLKVGERNISSFGYAYAQDTIYMKLTTELIERYHLASGKGA